MKKYLTLALILLVMGGFAQNFNTMEKKTHNLSDSMLRTSLIVRSLQMLNPGYGRCEKCGLPWNYCDSKSVMTSETNGTFATCQFCWDNSTLEELKNYYTATYVMQERGYRGTEYKMNHTLKHLLSCVEKEWKEEQKEGTKQ